ncbi:hypothetical protein DSO57_1038196 [Entomophthora muscae]|uniref:Uncharacterized protein n=1 Tax=Entomophthora muscae TaxID=34485 RepID=A0ACC2T9Y9_9FUNG|nr:hypothetical protein DSO57_1038196 [Entomophthora muscae]
MVFNSNIFDGASSQASFNGGKAQNVEAPVYTQAFEADNIWEKSPYELVYGHKPAIVIPTENEPDVQHIKKGPRDQIKRK